MSNKTLKTIIALLVVLLLAACFRIFSGNAGTTSNVGMNNGAQATMPMGGARQSNKPYNNNNNNGGNYNHSQSGNQDYQQPNVAGVGNYPTIAVASLPKEGQSVLQLIQSHGSFPYRQDGQVFSNREGVLPSQSHGYYQEYTVPTPGADNRGARRIIAGKGKTGDAATSGEYYYTEDHYRSFSRIRTE